MLADTTHEEASLFDATKSYSLPVTDYTVQLTLSWPNGRREFEFRLHYD